MKFPSTKKLAKTIAETQVAKGRRAKDSISFLVSRRPALQGYESLWDFVSAADQGTAPAGTFHHLSLLTRIVALEFWRKQIFIGKSAIDDLLFQLVKDVAVADPIGRIVEIISQSGVHRPGF